MWVLECFLYPIFLNVNISVINTGGIDGSVQLWDLQGPQLVAHWKDHRREINCLKFDGDIIATGSADKTVTLYDAHGKNY